VNGARAGQVILLSDGALIGRSGDCAIRLNDPAVSRQHARLRFASDRWFIQDLGSAGGTYLNGAAVKAGGLKNGDRIRVGSTEFELHT
jgi:pSer/pThr/pTyr-binding forkhead associated (FHA) protein